MSGKTNISGERVIVQVARDIEHTCKTKENGGRIKVAAPVKRVEVRRLAFIGFGCIQ